MRLRTFGAALILIVLALAVTGCAGNKLNTVISLAPVISSEIQAVQSAVEGQKVDLQAEDCTTDPTKPQNCYIAFQRGLLVLATYDQAFHDALAAVNTTSVRTALAQMSGLVSQWVTTHVIRLPDRIRPYIVIALEALRAGLLTASVSVGG